jgi:hypothetical protein
MSDFSPPKPQKEHEWLQQLVGEWVWESDSPTGLGKESQNHRGTEIVRSLGRIWVVGKGRGSAPDGTLSTTIMTLGYSPGRNKFVGTFVASSMTDLWIYEGFIDRDSNALVLDTEGPSFADMSKRTRYKDIIRIIDENNRTMTSLYQGESGTFDEFMTLRYRRTGT